jgi:NAD(P)-dependent dehydrogenase (short-subunit alcohol dehydrogenase family)
VLSLFIYLSGELEMSEKKVAIVTGGGTGIGAACVRELSAKGFRVGIHYRSSVDAAASLLATIGDGFLLTADLADIGQVEAMTEQIKKETDRVDVLVNNAGVSIRSVRPSGAPGISRKGFSVTSCSAPAAAGSST